MLKIPSRAHIFRVDLVLSRDPDPETGPGRGVRKVEVRLRPGARCFLPVSLLSGPHHPLPTTVTCFIWMFQMFPLLLQFA